MTDDVKDPDMQTKISFLKEKYKDDEYIDKIVDLFEKIKSKYSYDFSLDDEKIYKMMDNSDIDHVTSTMNSIMKFLNNELEEKDIVHLESVVLTEHYMDRVSKEFMVDLDQFTQYLKTDSAEFVEDFKDEIVKLLKKYNLFIYAD